jgi:hypothetical protein
VTVNESAVRAETESTQLGDVITSSNITGLPLNWRVTSSLTRSVSILLDLEV